MSSVTSISVLLTPADGEQAKLENFISNIDDVCIGGSYTDDLGFWENPLHTENDLMLKIDIRGFVQIYDIKHDVLSLFDNYNSDLGIEIYFENLENFMYGEIKKTSTGEYFCHYVNENEIADIMNNDEDDYYGQLDNVLKSNFETIKF